MATKPATSQIPVHSLTTATRKNAVRGIKNLLQQIGENPKREGLLKTPERVVKAFEEMTQGYKLDPAQILSTTFDETSDEMVMVRDIEFVSLCEHHLLPFTGKATVAYLPRTRVVGLSKLARLVDCFSQRLQVQERLTSQITGAIMQHLRPLGAGCLIEAHHQCMSCRGVRKANATMITSSLVGTFREDVAVRTEFLMLAK